MTGKVVAIGIDGPNSALLDEWLAKGLMPNLAGIAARGVCGNVTHTKRFRNERCWDAFLAGREVGGTGSAFVPQSYVYFNESLQREDRYEPFFALGDARRVCVFDFPATISSQVNGIQIAGWGSELNAVRAVSQPAPLMAEIVARHGADPKLVDVVNVRDAMTGEVEKSYVLPSLYDRPAVLEFGDRLRESVRRRTEICLDLLGRGEWDLFMALFPEGHSANHMLWHLERPHPLTPPEGSDHVLKDMFQEIDRGIGRIVDAVSPEQNVVVFTIDHTGVNNMDVPGMALLPELLYRWCFNGRAALAEGDASRPVEAIRTDFHRHWKHEVWALRTPLGEGVLLSPGALEAQGDPLSWNPAAWYRACWPQMRAFALPSVGDGYVRLNVKGREGSGLVEAEEFARTLDTLTAMLAQTSNPRTGLPLVKRVLRMRETPFESPDIPPDLVVCWDDDAPADGLDCPQLGRIGPLPYFRSGGHVSHGSAVHNIWMACGPQVPGGGKPRSGLLEDIPATLLDLIGVELPATMSGRSLLR